MDRNLTSRERLNKTLSHEEPELVNRFFEATTEGVLPVVQAQLEMGVDGILGATDWCFKTGPIISPKMFDRFFCTASQRDCKINALL